MLNPGPLRRVYVSFAEPPIAPDDAQKEIMLLRAELQQTRELLQQQVQEAHELKQKLSQTQDKLRDLKVNQDEAAAALAGQLTDAREQLRKAEKREQNAMQRTKAIGEALLEERASGQELRDQAQKLQRKVERLNEGTETVAETLTRQPALSASAGIRRKLVTQKAKVQLTARRKSFASPALSRGRRVGRSDIVAFEPSGFIFDLWVARRANGPEMRILVRRD
ncbi:hypothetical protein PsYK624_162360 [Phanerochaete sordida]|uniref:Uncharacterized protein n=1 Tax=Phanerochaete sordida TaxID=48140 RepID=A0A9P3GV62_9APHY|nr:hypothetical protein PsYK624_162360 [Phanerochaete sordida]